MVLTIIVKSEYASKAWNFDALRITNNALNDLTVHQSISYNL